MPVIAGIRRIQCFPATPICRHSRTASPAFPASLITTCLRRCGSVPPKLLLFPIPDRSLVARDGAKCLASSKTGF
jgi:hypothetical protein